MVARNILLISFDDAVAPWPYKTAFHEPIRLPNLDKLCGVSTAFHSAYAQAPICGASRASMLTSRMPHELDIVDNSTIFFDRFGPEACWAYQLKQNGYFCSSGGKVHHKPTLRRPQHRVLYSDERKAFSIDNRLPRELRKRSKRFGGFRNGRGAKDGIDDDFFFDKQAADSAISFLSDYEGSQPFYREVGFVSPHTPHITPARFKEMYDAENLRRPDDWDGYVADSPYVINNIPENEDFRSEGFWQKSVRNYFSAYSHGDYHLGRVLDALKSSGHADNTIVIVVSDHGFHLGNRNLFRKTTLWEQCLHVPIIIFDPARPIGQVVDDPVALLDVGPTVLDLSGITPSEELRGRSLRPMLAGERDPDRVVPSFYRKGVTIRKGRFRIIRYGKDDFQLFDLASDYWQLNNLGTDHEYFAPMRNALEIWAQEAGYDFSAQDMKEIASASEEM